MGWTLGGWAGSLQSPQLPAGLSFLLCWNNAEESDHQKQNQSLSGKELPGICSHHPGEKFIQGRAGGKEELPVPHEHTLIHGFLGSPSDPLGSEFSDVDFLPDKGEEMDTSTWPSAWMPGPKLKHDLWK